jgi:TRAP-type C4-dicarboxylate transport system permease small subunit
MKALNWMEEALARLEGWLIVLFLGQMVGFTFILVFLRALYTHGHLTWANSLMGHLEWSEPMARLLVLWLTFLGASLVTRENKHIKIDLLSAVLPAHWLRIRDLLLAVVCILITAVMFKTCLDYTGLEREFGSTLFLNLPAWVGELILPIGFASMTLRFAFRAVTQIHEMARGTER